LEDLLPYARIGKDWDHVWATDLHCRTEERLDPVVKRDDGTPVLK